MTAVERIDQLRQPSQRLQPFQEWHGSQLSHADQVWFYQAGQHLECSRAVPSSGLPRRSPLEDVRQMGERVQQMIQLARAIAQTARSTRQRLPRARG
jgi:hypothetical protein